MMKEKTSKQSEGVSAAPRPRHEVVLEDSAALLVQNMILSEETLELLQTEQVITGSGLREIKGEDDRVERNGMVLREASRRGEKAVKRLCHVLDQTGHRFLALHVSRQLDKDPEVEKDGSDVIFRKFPELSKALRPNQQKALVDYIADKISEGVIASTWRGWTAEADMAVAAVNRGLEDELGRDARTKQLHEQVAELTTQLKQERALSTSRQQQLGGMETRITESTQKHENQMKTLLHSFDASERANALASERMSALDGQVKSLTTRILHALHGDDADFSEADEGNHLKTGRVDLTKLEHNLTMLIEVVTNLRSDIGTLRTDISTQRRELLWALDVKDQGQTVMEALTQGTTAANGRMEEVAGDVAKISTLLHFTSSLVHFTQNTSPGRILSSSSPTTSAHPDERPGSRVDKTPEQYKRLFLSLQAMQVDNRAILVQVQRLLGEKDQQLAIIAQKNLELEDCQQRPPPPAPSPSKAGAGGSQWKDKKLPALPPITPRRNSHQTVPSPDGQVPRRETPDTHELSEVTGEVKRLNPVPRLSRTAKASPGSGRGQNAVALRRQRQQTGLAEEDQLTFIVKQIGVEGQKK